MKIHLFSLHMHGGWTFHSTQLLSPEATLAKLHHSISGLEFGDAVRACNAWMIYDGSGKWRTVHASTPGFEQLGHLLGTISKK